MSLVIRIKKKIKNILEPFFFFFEPYYRDYRFIKNINMNVLNPKQKRVLISYVTMSSYLDYKHDHITHTLMLELPIIIKTFTDRGFTVDLAHCEDTHHLNEVKSRRYDVVFGFGRPWSVALHKQLNVCSIIYLTECAPAFSLHEEKERIEYYYKRHAKHVPLMRTGKYFHSSEIALAKYGIFMGNAYTADSYYRDFGSMHLNFISPSGLYNNSFKLSTEKKFPRDVFLWFGSSGVVHKGLDILVDAFKEIPEAKLLIAGCALAEEKYLIDYKNYNNIENVGFLDVQSDKFLEVIAKSGFIIFPSASEGMSTAVLTCMRHGLIPVITRSCGIDVYDFGYIIDSYKVEDIIKLIHKIMLIDEEQLCKQQKQVYELANKLYTLDSYSQQLSTVVDKILFKEL